MSNRQMIGLALLTLLLAGTAAAVADPLERDIVRVEPTTALTDEATPPGLVDGESILFALQDALELVRSGIPRAALPGLNSLDRKLRQLLVGEGPDSPLPASYRQGNELWLPVQAQGLRVWLGAPDLRLRAVPRHAPASSNLPALAKRTHWLPLRRTANLIESALPLAATGERARSGRLLQEAMRGISSRLVFEQPQQIRAYYTLEAALAALPHWNEPLRNRLRHAAEQLSGDDRFGDLGNKLQAQADSITPDFRALMGLALDLRRRLTPAGGNPQAVTSTRQDGR